MAERRMLTKKVTDDDHFMELSASAQALYLHLTMSADDDGFCNQVNVCMFKAHASVQDLESLLNKRYLLQFENGVIVIKHWRMANALRKDRYTPTAFQEELARLDIKENGSYSLSGNQMATNRQPDGNQSAPQYRLDKDRLDKVSKKEKRFTPPTVEEVAAYCVERRNGIDPESFVDFYQSKGWMVGKDKMSDWQAAVRTWERRDKQSTKKGKNDKLECKPIQAMNPEELMDRIGRI